jgi:ribosomal protein S21
MITSPVKNGGVEGALRYLKRMMQIAGILKSVKERKYFMKKSVKNREKRKERDKKVMKAKRIMSSMRSNNSR